jgi:CheY-like chemotaxis protein
VRTAHGGVEAVQVAKQFFPQAMILDLGMPEMDGYAVARVIREDHALTNTRLIALSGYGQPEDRRRTAEAGFEEHLIKPVEPEKLLEVLRREEAFADTLSRLT